MKKRYLCLLIPVVALAAVRFLPKAVASPEVRTRAYFAVQRGWMAHWPFERGKYRPRVLLPAVWPVTPVWYQVETEIKMHLDPDDLVSRTILETGEWEPTSWEAMRQHLGRGATFIDVGAHIGYYSLKAAPVVGPSGHVIAIEPNPETLRELEANIRSSDARVISVQPVACYDAETTLELFAAPEANTGATSLSKANASQAGVVVQAYKVRARPLDDIVSEAGVTRVDMIKIDVEGAEYVVLKGAQKTLARFHPVVLAEILDHNLRAMGSSTSELIGFMRTLGYTPRRSVEDNVEFEFEGI